MKTPKAKKLPSGQWFCRVRTDGQDISITRPTQKEAVAEAMAIKAGLKAAPKTGAKLTLGAALDKYIDERRGVRSAATIRSYCIIRNANFKVLMKIPLDKISKQLAQKEIALEAAEKSPKTVCNAWSLCCSVFKENGMQAPSISLPAKIPNHHEFLNAEQIPLFLKEIEGAPVEIAALLGLHSLRLSEIMDIKRSDIDLEAGTIQVSGAAVLNENDKLVRQRQNKNASSNRLVPILIPRLRSLVSEISSGYIVTLPRHSICRHVNRACDAAGLPRIGAHGLRHSFASLCYAKNVPSKVTQLIGGWSDDVTMRKIYTHISQKDIAKQVDVLQSFFQNGNENGNEI